MVTSRPGVHVFDLSIANHLSYTVDPFVLRMAMSYACFHTEITSSVTFCWKSCSRAKNSNTFCERQGVFLSSVSMRNERGDRIRGRCVRSVWREKATNRKSYFSTADRFFGINWQNAINGCLSTGGVSKKIAFGSH